MKTHIFSHYNPKFQLQIHYTLKLIAENAPISGTNFDFLMYFYNSIIPSVTYLFLPQERKEDANLRYNCTKCVFGVNNQLRVKITQVKMCTSSFKLKIGLIIKKNSSFLHISQNLGVEPIFQSAGQFRDIWSCREHWLYETYTYGQQNLWMYRFCKAIIWCLLSPQKFFKLMSTVLGI